MTRFLAAFFLCLAVPPAEAVSTGGGGHFDVALLSNGVSICPGRPFKVGLRMVPEPGWHTYWKNPGDAGLPLKIRWTLPSGFTAGPIEWPTPVRFETGPLVSYGYDDAVLLAVLITPPERIESDSVTLVGTFDWLECAEVCVPGSATLDLTLPVRDEYPKASEAVYHFETAWARTPVSSGPLVAKAGPRAITLTIEWPRKGTWVDPLANGAYFFSDQELLVDYAGAQRFDRTEEELRLTIPLHPNLRGFPERLTGVLQLGRPELRGRGSEVDVPLALEDSDPAAKGVVGLWIPVGALAAGIMMLSFILIRRSRRTHDTGEKT